MPRTLTEFQTLDSVRLLDDHGDVESGTRGRILGKFERSSGTNYVVSFEGKGVRIVEDVRPDEIVRSATLAPPPTAADCSPYPKPHVERRAPALARVIETETKGSALATLGGQTPIGRGRDRRGKTHASCRETQVRPH